MKRNSGFTLLELLISATISALVIVGIYSAFRTGLLGYRKIESAFRPYQSARVILDRMGKELRNSFAYKAGDSGFLGQEKKMGFFTILGKFEGGELVAGLSRVEYCADGRALQRSIFFNEEAFKNDPEARAVTSSYNIQDISFAYAAALAAPAKGCEWQVKWPKDDTQKNSLPLAVRIRLVLATDDARQDPVEFNKLVAIPSRH